ncbi:MAG TPA: hypothetical protein VLF89_05720 [Candidatus Saccharimonadales bacterium]|nr:hypothetical protein [Candidatus Saccharimonadales bacterium]
MSFEARKERETAGNIQQIVIEKVSELPSVKDLATKEGGLESFKLVKPVFLLDLLRARGQNLGLSLPQYEQLLKGDTEITQSELAFFGSILGEEGMEGFKAIGSWYFEGFLARAHTEEHLKEVLVRQREDDDKRPLYFNMYALGWAVAEVPVVVEIVDGLLTDMVDSPENPGAEKVKLANDLQLQFNLYDTSATVLNNAEKMMSSLEEKYQWLQTRSRITYANAIDTTFPPVIPDSAAIVFARNMFSAFYSIYPNRKDFIERTITSLTNGGLFLVDDADSLNIRNGQRYRNDPLLKPLQYIYGEEEGYGTAPATLFKKVQ